ncbi:MAG TPA: hypothetical protein VLF79_00335 [Candidatus Saccharimonadales bacterium]|nr:hypothetical protein [Candidatus Saccharimonadales bacterium]
MKEKIDQEVSVVTYYSAKHKLTVPHLLHWQNQDFRLGKVDYYHNYMEGRDRQHIFELIDKDSSLWFRLRLDSSNLHWTLEAIHDGLAD